MATEWTEGQRQCFSCHGGTLLVSAAAGSGKTTVLIERIMRRITDEKSPIDIDRILVVTFTNAAATEMRQRLTAALAKTIAENPDDLRLQRQQLLLPRASICTVDSFCINLVRENFPQLGISPLFKIAESGQLLLLQKDALEDTLGHFYAENDPVFGELVAMLSDGKTDRRLIALIETLYEFIQSYPDPDRWLTESAALYENIGRVGDTVWGGFVLDRIAEFLEQSVRQCDAALDATKYDTVLAEKYTAAIEDDRALIQHLLRCARDREWDMTFTGICSFKQAAAGRQKDFTDVEGNARITALRGDVKSTLEGLAKLACGDEAACRADLHTSARLIGKLYEMVRHYTAVLTEKKRAANLLDFADTEHLALQLLTAYDQNGNRTPTPLAKELSERFEEIMVDEYQDTNAVQDALFEALSRDGSNLFFVGDVKQSIYAFRKAMPELFIGRRDRYPAFDGEHYPGTITLGNNFRSRRTVTDAVNFVFRQLMQQEVGDITYDQNEELVFSAPYPTDESDDPYVTECLVVDGTQYDQATLDKDEAEAQVIAEQILRLKQEFTTQQKDKTKRPLRYSDCCILLRSRDAHAGTYRRVLAEYGIPSVAQTKSGFFEAAEVRLTLSLLRCIDNPLQDVPFTAVMLSPVFGFSPDDLARIRLHRPDTPLYMAASAARTHADASLAARCTHLITVLDRYRTLSALLTVDRLVSRLYDDLALPDLLSARFGGNNRAENLSQLYEMCTRFEQGGFRGLSTFIRHIDRLQEQRQDLPAATGQGAEDAVRILSIHGSKGLEFPVVFLAGLCVGFNNEDLQKPLLAHSRYGVGMNLRDPETLTTHTTLPRQGVLLMRKSDDRAEALRVLYVAMTRAREKLYLVMQMKEPVKTLSKLAASLDPDRPTLPTVMIREAGSLGDWIAATLLRHPDGGELRRAAGASEALVIDDPTPLRIHLVAPPDQTAATTEDETAVAPDPALVETLRERIAYVYPHEALARVPTKLAASTVSADPTRPELVAHARPSFLGSSGLTPAERGTAMHDFMQFADYARAEADLEAEITRLSAHGYLTAAAAASLDRKALSAFFGSELYRRLQSAEQVLREYHFTFRETAAAYDPSITDAAETVVLQGMVDCAFIENGELVIVDYKTDRVKTPEPLVERYAAQLNIYAHALGTVLERPVKECQLYSFALGRSVRL